MKLIVTKTLNVYYICSCLFVIYHFKQDNSVMQNKFGIESIALVCLFCSALPCLLQKNSVSIKGKIHRKVMRLNGNEKMFCYNNNSVKLGFCYTKG